LVKSAQIFSGLAAMSMATPHSMRNAVLLLVARPSVVVIVPLYYEDDRGGQKDAVVLSGRG
jgi:hypothetical protein